jgi:hypothetical protein
MAQTRDLPGGQVPGFYHFMAMMPDVSEQISMIPIDCRMPEERIHGHPIAMGHHFNVLLILSSK